MAWDNRMESFLLTRETGSKERLRYSRGSAEMLREEEQRASSSGSRRTTQSCWSVIGGKDTQSGRT